jgi:hypothetical protein
MNADFSAWPIAWTAAPPQLLFASPGGKDRTMTPSSEAAAMVGAHRVVFEAADMISVHFGPTLTEEEMEAIVNVQARHAAGRAYFLILDFTRIGTISAAARRAVGRSTTKLRFRGIAMYGASFHMKIMARLVNTALAIFSKRPFPQQFFDSREAALIWVEELRKQPIALEA